MYRSISKSRRIIERILDKFNVSYSIIPHEGSVKLCILRLIYAPSLLDFINIGDFSIFSYEFVKRNKGKLFDEVFISRWEDTSLSLKLIRTRSINFKLGSEKGKNLGQNSIRNFRNIINRVYFDSKIKLKFENSRN